MPSDDIEHPVGRLGPEPDHSITSMVLPKPIASAKRQVITPELQWIAEIRVLV